MGNSKNLTFTINGLSFKMIHVKGGAFVKDGKLIKLPDYYIGETPVTQALWTAVRDSNPSLNVGDENPVENVSYLECGTFIDLLNDSTGEKFTFPTEVQWEFAAIGGMKSKGYQYSGSDNIDEVAWYRDNSDNHTHPVALKKPNELGIYDMTGNVNEFCSDYWARKDFNQKIIKGGSYEDHDYLYGDEPLRIFIHSAVHPTDRLGYAGLRLVLNEVCLKELNSPSKEKASELIHTAFKSIKLEIEEMEVNESYICTQYVIKSFKMLKGFRGRPTYKIEKTLPEYLYPYLYRLSITADSIFIEVKNEHPLPPPSLLPQLESEEFINSSAKIPIPIGETMDGRLRIMDIAKAPHVLIAGCTMQGKTEFLHSTIASLLHPRNQPCELVLIDPKGCEFKDRYSSVVPEIYVTADEVLAKLNSLLDNLQNRYIVKAAMIGDLTPIVVIIDEYADLTMAAVLCPAAKKKAREIETAIIRLAQKGNPVGIHVILATQRPSINVITGLIKSNFPTRIAFRVVSKEDSLTILDTDGAEKLLGHGDMLFAEGVEIERLQGYRLNQNNG